ncbi:hypothetical protein [Nitrosomonas sp.]|uniref:hypothetical protein n=1 Tax=Nitrosomonas sp. TaxID=42353 RepID=UPI0025F2DEF7|nr:hypothetical protein [Nitrosomonas sp.]MBV6448244.1 hypothetical protein [Nitrosomonas sp.]
MNIHKRTRLTLLDRQKIWWLYQTRLWKVVQLAEHFHVSRPTIYDVLKRVRLQELTPRNSTNQRFKTLQYALKRAAKRYNKTYPGELVHFDTKRPLLLIGQSANEPREYLFVATDDFSRELYTGILPDKTQHSAASFLTNTVCSMSLPDRLCLF